MMTKVRFLVLYISFGVSLLAFKEVAHRGVHGAPSLWMGPVQLAILFVLFLPWFLKLPSGGSWRSWHSEKEDCWK